MTVTRTIIVDDDASPPDGDLTMMVLHSDWQRRHGNLLRIDIVPAPYEILSDSEIAQYLESGQPYGPLQGNVLMLDFHSKCTVVLRVSGGHAPSVHQAWNKCCRADRNSGILPTTFTEQCNIGHRDGEYYVGLPGDGQKPPAFVFTAADRKHNPALAKALQNLTTIAAERQPFYAHVLQRFPEPVPFRAAMARAYPGWPQARHEYS